MYEKQSNKITVINFKDESRNIYADFPLDKETAKRLSKRIFKNAMTDVAAEREKQSALLESLTVTTAIPLDNNIQACLSYTK